MNADEYLVFDFETTGLSPSRDRIIQVGLCHVSNGVAASRQSWFVRQDVPIHPVAMRLHGITAEKIQEHGIPPHDSLARLIEEMRTAPVLVGHNIHRFDVPFLLAECRRLHMEPPNCAEFIDTAALFKGMKLRLAKRPLENHRDYADRVLSIPVRGLSYSIETCIGELGIELDTSQLHDAAQDAFATSLIFRALRHLT